jgi:hypothetical protein
MIDSFGYFWNDRLSQRETVSLERHGGGMGFNLNGSVANKDSVKGLPKGFFKVVQRTAKSV